MEPHDQKNLIVLSSIEGNDTTHLKGIQIFLDGYVGFVLVFWWIVFFCTLTVIIVRTVFISDVERVK
jgi:hypothetical protein